MCLIDFCLDNKRIKMNSVNTTSSRDMITYDYYNLIDGNYDDLLEYTDKVCQFRWIMISLK